MKTPLIYWLASLLTLFVGVTVEADVEEHLLGVLTPEQAQAYAEGLAPEEIELPNGEALAEYVVRQERKGRAGLVLRTLEPCVIVDTSRAVEKALSGYPLGLLLRGEARDLSSYGGSAEGCGIPDLEGEVFFSNRARALLLSVEIRDALESGSLAFESTGRLVTFRPLDTTTASSLIVPLCGEESTDPCAEGDLVLLLEGQAEVTVAVHGYLEPVGLMDVIQTPDLEGGENLPTASVAKAAGDTPWIEGTDNIHYLGGKVGIGTQSPNSLLVVTDDSSVGGEPKAAATIDATGNTSNDWALSLRASSAPGQVDDLMMVRGDGRVGIGTKSPITDFHLEGQAYISGDLVLENDSMIRGRKALGGTAAGAALFNSATPGSSDIDTNPGYGGYLLHNLFWDGTQWAQPRGDMYSQAFSFGHHYDMSWWRSAPSGANGSGVSLTRSMVIKRTTGNVGIGSSSPASRLVVSQNGFLGHSDWAVSFDSRTSDAATSVLHLRNSNAESVLFARSDGNLGIGTENPSHRLHVNAGDQGGVLVKQPHTIGGEEPYFDYVRPTLTLDRGSSTRGATLAIGRTQTKFYLTSADRFAIRLPSQESVVQVEQEGRIQLGLSKNLMVDSDGRTLLRQAGFSGTGSVSAQDHLFRVWGHHPARIEQSHSLGGDGANPPYFAPQDPTLALLRGSAQRGATLSLGNQSGSFHLYANHQAMRLYAPDGTTAIQTLTPAGNTGLGIDLPTERLEVSGNVKVSGDIQLSGNLVSDGDICIGHCG